MTKTFSLMCSLALLLTSCSQSEKLPSPPGAVVLAGVALGGGVDECSYGIAFDGKHLFSYDKEPSLLPCYQATSPRDLTQGKEVKLLFEKGSVPKGVRKYATVFILDGRVEEIQLETSRGFDESHEEMLLEKFGKPSSVEYFNAWSQKTTRWTLPNAEIEYENPNMGNRLRGTWKLEDGDIGLLTAWTRRKVEWDSRDQAGTGSSF